MFLPGLSVRGVQGVVARSIKGLYEASWVSGAHASVSGHGAWAGGSMRSARIPVGDDGCHGVGREDTGSLSTKPVRARGALG